MFYHFPPLKIHYDIALSSTDGLVPPGVCGAVVASAWLRMSEHVNLQTFLFAPQEPIQVPVLMPTNPCCLALQDLLTSKDTLRRDMISLELSF